MSHRPSLRLSRVPAALLAVLAVGCASGGPPQGAGEEGPRRPRAEGRQAGERGALSAAEKAALRVARVEVTPDTVRLEVGETAAVEAVARDSSGAEVEEARIGRSLRGGAAEYDAATGRIEGREPGEATFLAVVQVPARPRAGGRDGRAGGRDGRAGEPRRVTGRAVVIVEPLPVVRLELTPPDGPLYAGTRARLGAAAFSEARRRDEAPITWSSSDTSVVRVDRHGLLRAAAPGSATVTAASGDVRASAEVRVAANPVREVEIAAPDTALEVGRPVRLEAAARDTSGGAVADAPLEWTVQGPDGGMTEAAYLDEEGWFVAEEPGLFRVTATVGSRSAAAVLEARPGPARRPMEVVGHGPVPDRATSDLWVFRGVDGRDYAYTGTHAAGAGGNVMYAWDVTDPTEPVITDSVVVDARVVNDVKINETRNLAVITREGASDRRNGIVILDIRVPAHPRVVTGFTENLTSGVHNVWIEGRYVYAVHNGTRALHVIDIGDPSSPRQVGRWQLDAEDRYLHDVTVRDGLAYLSYWDHGLVILDVGRGVAGGTPTDPALVSRYAYRGRFGSETYGNTHHAVPYGDYVFVGDEIFGCAECVNGPRGYVHVIDVSDLENPREVAWYRVPEAGTHNLWAEDGRLYVAHYQGGVRVVDVTGELRGDLYRQGREIGWFMTEPLASPDVSAERVFRANATMAWGPQPHGGHLYVSDMSSGLWILDFADESDRDDDGS